MRYEEVLDKAIEMLHEGISEGKIIKGAVEESDEHEDNAMRISDIGEEVVGSLSDAEVLSLTTEAPNLLIMEPDFDCGSTSPMAILRENVCELITVNIWDVFENEGGLRDNGY